MSETTPAIDPAAAAVATPAGRLFRAGACMFLATLALYAATTQHGPAWQDSGIFQRRILHNDFRGELGIALAHPLLIAVGSLFRHLPVGDVAYRINLVSAVFGAIAAASLLMLMLRLFPGRWLISLATAGWFALAHTPWWLGTICESQIILAAIFTLELHAVVSLVRRPALASAAMLGLLNGLGLATHNLALLALPAYGLLVLWLAWKRRLPVAGVGLFVAAWCVGASPWIGLVMAEAGRSGLVAAVKSGLFGTGWQRSVLVGSGRALTLGPAYVLMNFPNLALPLAAAGLVLGRRRLTGALPWVWGYLLAAYLLFAIRYDVPDQFMFFLPAYAMIAVWAGVGLGTLTDGRRRRWLTTAALVSVLWTPVVYALAPTLWKRANLPVPGRKDLAYRDPVRYWLWPWKGHERSAELFARDVLEALPPGSLLVADLTAYQPLRWMQEVHGLGRGVTVIPTGSKEADTILLEGHTNVYVVSPAKGYAPAWMLEAAEFPKVEDAPVYRAKWKSGR